MAISIHLLNLAELAAASGTHPSHHEIDVQPEDLVVGAKFYCKHCGTHVATLELNVEPVQLFDRPKEEQ